MYDFVDELLNVRDQQLSARVSRMLGQHGEAILNSIRARQPDLVEKWAADVSGEILAGTHIMSAFACDRDKAATRRARESAKGS